jgi:uncharacterized protein
MSTNSVRNLVRTLALCVGLVIFGGVPAVEIPSSLLARAKAGDAQAQLELGKFYRNNGKPEELQQAAQWYLRSAEQGNAEAQLLLGFAYLAGVGLTKDEKNGISWIQKAANFGFPKAQAIMGAAYLDGLYGLSKDISGAKEWLTKAALQGEPGAEYLLWREYSSGTNYPKDLPAAVEMLRKSANHGYATAQAALALGLMDGTGGIQKNESEGLRLLRVAADNGEPLAMYTLGLLYAKGRLVTRDHVQAFAWAMASNAYSASAESKASAKYLLDLIYPGLSEDELVRAKEMARQLITEIYHRKQSVRK